MNTLQRPVHTLATFATVINLLAAIFIICTNSLWSPFASLRHTVSLILAVVACVAYFYRRKFQYGPGDIKVRYAVNTLCFVAWLIVTICLLALG